MPKFTRQNRKEFSHALNFKTDSRTACLRVLEADMRNSGNCPSNFFALEYKSLGICSCFVLCSFIPKIGSRKEAATWDKNLSI